MKTIQVTAEEEQLFLEWLKERETGLLSQLRVLQALRQKISVDSAESKENQQTENEDDTSWVEKIEAVFKLYKKSLSSGEIINQIMKQYEPLAKKGRKYVTKAVTSKLWVMQEKGVVTKEILNGRNVYTFKL